MRSARGVLACSCLLLASVPCAQSPLLKSSGYVNDFAELLDPPARVALSERLKEVETRTSSEIAVATVKSLDGMSVEEYANRLFKAWGVGHEKTDNGVLPDGIADIVEKNLGVDSGGARAVHAGPVLAGDGGLGLSARGG